MKIERLNIDNLRVIEALSLTTNKGVNVVIGNNGAGKTSVLEGIYLAGRGRSFRHTDSKPLVRHGAEEAVVVCTLVDEKTESHSRLGLARGPKTLRCRLNGEDIQRRSQLAEVLPVQWIGSQPQVFLEAGPDVRRRFLDMAVFHVEHGYLSQIGEYQRILKQRNAALRSRGKHDVAIWNPKLAELGQQIDQARQRAVRSIFTRVEQILVSWDLGFTIAHRYQSGWNTETSLQAELNSRIQQDEFRGFTSKGPHRAELDIRCKEGLASKVLSRGQQKMLVVAIHLAALDSISTAITGKQPVLLVDDLAAELDFKNRSKVMDAVVDRDCQAFVTCLSNDQLPAPTGCSTWNMEHGRIV